MLRWSFLCFLWLVLVQPLAAQTISQKEWMSQLVDALGWGYGLPDAPTTEDYLQLLSGKRILKVEVEDSFRKSDLVTIKRLTNYGEFSGTGWLSGQRETSQVHFDLLIPHRGSYQLTLSSRQSGVLIQLAGREFTVDAGEKFSPKNLGEVDLPAGNVEVTVTLPPKTGIDYLQLVAPPLPSVMPIEGWQPENEASLDDVSITAIQALRLLQLLPETDRRFLFEAEKTPAQPGTEVSTERHLGSVSGGKWVRAGAQSSKWNFQFSEIEPGCYQTVLRGMSSETVTISSEVVPSQEVKWGEAMRSASLGRICVAEGELSLQLILPARAGVDYLELRKLDASSEMLSKLLGVEFDRAVDEVLANELLALLSRLKN